MNAAPVQIPWPESTFPGTDSQESEGRLVNCFADIMGDPRGGKIKRIRSAGISLHALTAQSGYRGGLVVDSQSFECWSGNASKVDTNGVVTSIGTFPGTKNVSIARNQASPIPDVVAVDVDNGAYVLGSATVVAATATITILSALFNTGGTITLVFTNPALSALDPTGFPVSVTYTIGPGDTNTTIAAGLNALINANTVLSANNLTSTVLSNVITASHQGTIGNQTSVISSQQNAIAPAATNIGTAASNSGPTCALTGVNAPAGSMIVVCVNVDDGTHGGSCSDSVNGSYTFGTQQLLGGGSNGYGQFFYFPNSSALSGATITYTKASSGSYVAMSVFYVTGARSTSPIDTATVATAAGTSTSPSVTSGVPTSQYELMIGFLAFDGNGGGSYTQASGFSTPPNLVSAAFPSSLTGVAAGGNELNTSKSAVTFNPTITGSVNYWAAIIFGIIPGGGAGVVSLSPASGDLSGGTGTYGAFSGTPTAYTGQGAMTGTPNSVAFQDGYLFFTFPNGNVLATLLNSLIMSALTQITIQAKADVTLLRAIPFSGIMFFFTTGSCELWQDAALASPNFPYSRLSVLEFGLAQSTAIAGWETGFSELLWVAQDSGVYWVTSGSLSQNKVSPPDLDKLIEAEISAGNTLEAGCYISGGKKFWTLSSPDWTWEFNLQTKKWNERTSLLSPGAYGRWRGTGGHPAFGKWLLGDQQSGAVVFSDDTNPTELGTPMLYRVESAAVKAFPAQVRIARADFDFVFGVGQAVGAVTTAVTGASSSGGLIKLSVRDASRMATGDTVTVSGIVGTTEANGNWVITVVDWQNIVLQGSAFSHAYVSGGSVADLTSPTNAQSPSVAISCSRDGGKNWGNPLIRQLGSQQETQRARASVTSMGLSGTMGARWRVDITDPVYASLLGGTMQSGIRAAGI